ncbi:hypothetical protein ACFWBC_23140 [Streptomyces sp. NPDC059985]|uniref:hypothetical protein n=1 Tax=Streptomyces sp. NPDC059985 TaxID=3347025 RepID=UPI0036C80E4B
MNTSTRAGRRRTAGGVGIGRLYSTTISIAGTVIPLRVVIPRMTNRPTGVEGSFTAASCTPYESRRDSDSVMCSGTFTARDGSFSLTRVSADTTFDPPPTTPVATVVSGPDATEAVSAERRARALPGATGLLCLTVAVWNVTSLARTVRASRRPAGGGGSGGRLRAFPPGM